MLADLLSESYAADLEESWENERTANALTGVAVRLYQTGCLLRETITVLAKLGVERSHGAVWNWVHRLADSGRDPPTATPSRVAVDETAVKIIIEKWFHTLKMRIDRIHGWAVGRAPESGLNSSCITTTINDRTKLSTEKCRLRRCRTRQCQAARFFTN
jgi:transposase-like protein